MSTICFLHFPALISNEGPSHSGPLISSQKQDSLVKGGALSFGCDVCDLEWGRGRNQWFPRYLRFKPFVLLFMQHSVYVELSPLLLESPLVPSKARPNITTEKSPEKHTSFYSPALGRKNSSSSLDLLKLLC